MSSINDEKNSIASITDLNEKYNQSKEIIEDVKEITEDAKEIIKDISNEKYKNQLFGNDDDNVDSMSDKFDVNNNVNEQNVLSNVENSDTEVNNEENINDLMNANIEKNQVENTNNFNKNENDVESSLNEEKSDNSNKKEKKKFSIHKLIIILIGIALLGVVGILLFQKFTTKKVIDYKALPVVDVTHISKGSIGKDISLVGVIEPNNTYYIPAKVSGELKEIYVKNGDYVKKGDPICEIDASKEIEAAFIQYDTAKRTYERMQKLYRSGDISLQNFETVKAQYDGAKLSYDTKVEYAIPVAVGDGYVENTNMTINTNVGVGTVLCYITSDDGKEINFGVTERVLEGVELGEKVVIEKSGKTYEGYVSNIAKLVNSNTGLFDVKAIITSENNFAAGIMAKATFEYDRRTNVNVLPNDMIYYENGNAYVFVVDKDNYVRRKYIEVGLENKDKCEIVSGIDKNDKIVATWNNDLAEGVLVKIVNEEFPKDEIVKQSLTIKQPEKKIDETIIIDDPTIKYEIATIGEIKVVEEEKGDVAKLPNKKKLGEKKFGDKKFGDKKFGDKKFDDKRFDGNKFGDGKKIEETVANFETNATETLEATFYNETSATVYENNNILETSIVDDLKTNIETFERPTASINNDSKEIIESDDADFIQKLIDKYNELKDSEVTKETTVSMEVKQ